MRRTVYLDAVADLVHTQTYLGGLAKVDITKVNVGEGLERFLVAVAKVAVVADQSASLKARSLASLFTVTLLKGLGILMPLIKLKGEVAFHDEQYAATQTEIKRVLAAMVHQNETRQQDLAAFAALQRSFEQQQALAATHSGKSVEAKLKLSDGEMQYGVALMTDMKAAAIQLDELACAIRLELGLETNPEAFKQQTAELHKQMDAAIQELQTRAAAMREQAAQ